MAVEGGPRLGIYQLRRRPELSDNWVITWPDPARPGRTRRHSTGTSDVRAAELALAQFVVEQSELKDAPPAVVPLSWVTVRYFNGHAKYLPSKGEAKRHLAICTDHFGEATVDQVTPGRLRKFVADLRGKGWADSYIRRILATLIAALNFSYDAGELASVPRIRPSKLGLAQGKARERILELGELGALYGACLELAAADDVAGDVARELARYLVLLIGTGSRPRAALALTRFRVDLARNRLDLQPAEKAVSRKRQPILPIVPTLRAWLETAEGARVVGRGDKAIKLLWRAARAKAGLDSGVVPYSVRHTVATWLEEKDVAENQIDAWLGHAKLSTARAWYIKRRVYRPDYLSAAAAAIEELLAQIAAQTRSAGATTPALHPDDFCGVRATNVQPLSHRRGGKPLKSLGAGEGIRTLDPNLGKVVLYP